jgi:hypothetical protein
MGARKKILNSDCRFGLSLHGMRGTTAKERTTMGWNDARVAIEQRGGVPIFDATYDALWQAVGDLWFDGRRLCVIEEHRGPQKIVIEEVTPCLLRVHYDAGAEAETATWSIDLTPPDELGIGYDVCGVRSQTGHGVETLNNCLLGGAWFFSEGKAVRRFEQ